MLLNSTHPTRCIASPPARDRMQQLTGSSRRPLARAPGAAAGHGLGFRTDLLHEYDVLNPIGRGAFGQVSRGVHKRSGAEVAVKTLPKTREHMTREGVLDTISREVSLLQHVSGCPGVACLLDCFEDPHSVHIVTEICHGGDLKKHVEANGTLDEDTLAAVAFDILQILQGCHSKGIVYADVKPANFCLADTFSPEASTSTPRVKAVDFGCSKHTGSKRLRRRAGTMAFMAPEVFLQDFGYKADVWSLGITLYWLFAARVPYWDNATMAKVSSVAEVADAVSRAPICFDYGPWLHMSAEGVDFMQACLTRPEGQRLSVEQALQHPWLAMQAERSRLAPGALAPSRLCSLVAA